MKPFFLFSLVSGLLGMASSVAGEPVHPPRAFLGVITDALHQPANLASYYGGGPGSPDTSARLGASAAIRLRGDLGREERGLLIDWIVIGSPAANVIRNQDVLLAINGISLVSPAQLGASIQALQPGDLVTLTVWREGKILEVPVQLAERPEANDPPSLCYYEYVSTSITSPHQYQHHVVASLGDPPIPEFRGSPPSNWLDHRPRRDPDAFFEPPQVSRSELFHRDYRQAPWSKPDSYNERYNKRLRGHWITFSEGRRTFTVKLGDQVLFSGPIDSEAERRAVPRKYRQALNKAEKQGLPVITPATYGQHFDSGGSGRVTTRDAVGQHVELRIADGRKEISIIGIFERVEFRGPANSPEERAKVPSDALARLEKTLEQARELPAKGLTVYTTGAF